MIGTAALPHILMRYYTVPSVREARESVTWSLFFIFLLYFTAPALAVLVKYEVFHVLVGTPFDQLPAWVASWNKVDPTLMSITDINKDGLLQLNEMTIGGDIIVLATPVFLGEHLQFAPTQFFWFFVLTISGIMGGAWLSGRLAGRIPPKRQIRHGFLIMCTVAVLNLAANLLFPPHAWWALLPIAIFSFGWALMVPVVTLLVLDLHPERRGMASSMQAFVGSSANGLVAGLIAPLVMHSTVLLALASLLMMGIGLVAWIYLHHRWPDIGRTPVHL
eukprot:gene19107-38314_t